MAMEDVTATELMLVQVMKNQMAIIGALTEILDGNNNEKIKELVKDAMATVVSQTATLVGAKENGK